MANGDPPVAAEHELPAIAPPMRPRLAPPIAPIGRCFRFSPEAR